MSETPYQNRELDEKFRNVELLIREKHEDVMTKIGELNVKVSYTNGKVRWQEKMIYLAIGFCACISILILPILIQLIITHITN